MTGPVWTLSEHAIRELVRKHFDECRRSLARSVYAHYEYEGGDAPAGGIKIVTAKQTLYAAWGGGGSTTGEFIDYGSAEGNALAISLGNYVPISSGDLATERRRVLYPRLCYVWELDSSNVLSRTTEEIYVVNTGGLPIVTAAMFAVQKLEGSEYYAPVQKSSDLCRGSKLFYATPGITLDGDGTPKIVRTGWSHRTQTGTLAGANDESDFAHAEEFDIFIHHPGVYEITYGMTVSRTSSDSADDTEWTDSNGDTIDLPNTLHFYGELFYNYNPAGGNIATQFDTWDQIGVSVGARDTDSVTIERTVLLRHTLDNWHGQPYMRLSFAAMCQGLGLNGADATGALGECWVNIRPGGGGGYHEGSGFNAFNGSTYQWWGQGTEPEELFDADGVEIP